MIDGMLAFGMPGGWEWVVISIVFGPIFLAPLVVAGFVWAGNKRTRQQNQQLAAEADRLRAEIDNLTKQQ